MNREELLDQLTEDIFAYVMHGAVPERNVAQALKPQALDERFEEYELLLDLHFVMLPEVIEFVEQLPKRLRSIKTDTETVSQTNRGTVDGKINWGATIKQRYVENPSDSSLFVCDNRTEDYDSSENLVLKKALSVIYSTLREADEYLRRDYEWVRETWDQQLANQLLRIVERNVHIHRIRELRPYEPTERMLNSAQHSREAIYRDAANLLQTRRQLLDGEPDQLRRLLDETAITPDDENTLFELFVLFRFVATIERLYDDRFEFKTISSDQQEVARLEGDGEIVLYHDNSADDRELSFVSIADPDGRKLTRTEKVQTVAQTVANNYFHDREFRNHTGRPDLIVLEIRPSGSSMREYLITEVKNSTNPDTIRRGVKETLEYLAFLRVNDNFVFGRETGDDYFGNGWNGLLVVQDLAEETATLDEQADSEIKILQASELEDELEQVVRQVI